MPPCVWNMSVALSVWGDFIFPTAQAFVCYSPWATLTIPPNAREPQRSSFSLFFSFRPLSRHISFRCRQVCATASHTMSPCVSAFKRTKGQCLRKSVDGVTDPQVKKTLCVIGAFLLSGDCFSIVCVPCHVPYLNTLTGHATFHVQTLEEQLCTTHELFVLCELLPFSFYALKISGKCS